MKKLVCVLCAVLCSVLLCACIASVKSERSLADYAKKNYGNCELVSSQKPDDRHLICTFRDGEYGFEYEVKSSVNDITIDGSKFGETESTTDTFYNRYCAYILSSADAEIRQIEESCSCTIAINEYALSPLPEITAKDEKSAKNAAVELAGIFHRYDTRGVLSGSIIYAYDENKETLGKCTVGAAEWKNSDDMTNEFYQNIAKSIAEDAEFIGSKKIPFSKTGVDIKDVKTPVWETSSISDGDDLVTYYYFRSQGREFFIADFRVLKDEEDLAGEYYSNYKDIIR